MIVKGYCQMGQSLVRKWRAWSHNPVSLWVRSLRSNAASEAIAKASEERVHSIVLYNYPSFSGAYSALFAHLFHSYHNIPCLNLPFSSVAPLRFSSNLIFLIVSFLIICPWFLFVFIYQTLLFFTMGF